MIATNCIGGMGEITDGGITTRTKIVHSGRRTASASTTGSPGAARLE